MEMVEDRSAMLIRSGGAVEFVVSEDPAESHPWDMFLTGCPGAHHEQTSAWGKLKQIYGWTPVWVWVSRGARIVGGAMVLTRKVGGVATVGYVFRGPVWANNDPEAMRLAANAICQFARSRHLAYLVIVPPYGGEDLVELLRSLRFRRKPDEFPPSISTDTATLMIDLQQDLNAILAGTSMTKRQNIRQGLRRGVHVRMGNEADAKTFRTLMWSSCQRRGVSPSPPQRDFFENLWRMFEPTGVVKFFIAEIDGEAVSGACTFVFGGVMHLWRVGWSGKYDKHKPNDVLHWEAIKWAKENGCHAFDFMHMKPTHVRAVLGGNQFNDSYSGVSDFKTGFGGQLRLLPEPYYRSFQPVVHSALCLGGARVVEALCSKRVAAKMLKFAGVLTKKRGAGHATANGT